MMKRLRRYLVAGLLVWVPALVTVLVLRGLVNLLDRSLLLLPPEYRPEVWIGLNVPGFGLILTLVVLLVTGMLVANFIGRALVEGWESLIGRIPLIRSLYSGVKQVAEHLFDEEGKPFKQVVLIEYPRKGVWSLGFLTSERAGEAAARTGVKSMVSVFVPTTPNPTSGFFVMAAKEELHLLDMKIDDAMKMIISMGAVIPSWQGGAGRIGDEIQPLSRHQPPGLVAAPPPAKPADGAAESPPASDTGDLARRQSSS